MIQRENSQFTTVQEERLTAVEETSNAFQFVDILNRINRGDPGLFGTEEIEGFYSVRPERVSRPREVRLGFSILFN